MQLIEPAGQAEHAAPAGPQVEVVCAPKAMQVLPAQHPPHVAASHTDDVVH
jgi:hypothetical protein